MILAIDPGNIESGWCLINDDYSIVYKGKCLNEKLLEYIHGNDINHIVIEMVASYGMAVGQTIFDTCVWVGRFKQVAITCGIHNSLMYRKDVKMNLCGQTRAKDTNIRQALIDRFSYPQHAAKGGKGTIKDQGFFFGFKSDIWAAYAIAVTYLDKQRGE